MARVLELLANVEILGFDLASAEKAGAFAADLVAKGETIGVRDCMIAGIAIRYDEVLFTRNTRHFSKIPGLQHEPW